MMFRRRNSSWSYTKPIFLLIAAAPAARATGLKKLQWQSWSNGVFAQAQSEHRFVLLDLQAVRCHCCHIMDKTA
jgi:uncharacterized protein